MNIDVILTPLEAAAERINGRRVVVIDVFRATSCICAAMSAGARRLIPFTSIDECWQEHSKWQGTDERVVMCGERKMLPIEGFALGNSPLSYTKESVGDATVIMSTTNGTRSIQIAEREGATQVLVAALLNARAVADKIAEQDGDITLFCSGRADRFSIEDTLCAGYIATILSKEYGAKLSEVAWWASDVYNRYSDDLTAAMEHNGHYHRLNELGMGDDVNYALQRDIMDIVPRVMAGEVLL